VHVDNGARDGPGLINDSLAMLALNILLRKANLGPDVFQDKSTGFGHDLARRGHQDCVAHTSSCPQCNEMTIKNPESRIQNQIPLKIRNAKTRSLAKAFLYRQVPHRSPMPRLLLTTFGLVLQVACNEPHLSSFASTLLPTCSPGFTTLLSAFTFTRAVESTKYPRFLVVVL
jgi:hypothetical protein